MWKTFAIYIYLVEYTLNDLELLFPLECAELDKIVYHAGVTTKNLFKIKFKWLFIFNFASSVIRVEYIRVNFVLIAAKVVHHAGVATRMKYEQGKLGKKVDRVDDEMGVQVMIKNKNTNFAFLLGMFQLTEKHQPSLCSHERIFLLYEHGNMQNLSL